MNGLSWWSLLQKTVLNKFDFEFFEIYPLQLNCSTVINLFTSTSPSRCIFVSIAFSLYKLGFGRRAKIQATLSLKGARLFTVLQQRQLRTHELDINFFFCFFCWTKMEHPSCVFGGSNNWLRFQVILNNLTFLQASNLQHQFPTRTFSLQI